MPPVFIFVVALICRYQDELCKVSVDDLETRMELCEKLGDRAAGIENFKIALKYYHSMVGAANITAAEIHEHFARIVKFSLPECLIFTYTA